MIHYTSCILSNKNFNVAHRSVYDDINFEIKYPNVFRYLSSKLVVSSTLITEK